MFRSLFLLLFVVPIFAQHQVTGSAKIRLELEQLSHTARVLMIAAHPDDENTALLAYLARGRNIQTAYLSLNRGEGGQNVIGPEQGAGIGLIRTQELLAARRVDGAEQFFSRSIDFGFSKTASETLQMWGKEAVLADVVWVIRKFQPDVIINRFSGTPRDGHGNHQVSAMLSKEAFRAAADPNRFPEQLKFVKPWQAKRLYWNYFNWSQMDAKPEGNQLALDLGEFNPMLGYSYNEIAGISRTMHKSQAMGTPERKGRFNNYLELLDGDKAEKDLLEGIANSWARFGGGVAVGEALQKAKAAFDPMDPSKMVPALLEAKRALANVQDPRAKSRQSRLDELIANAAGLWLDAQASRYAAVPGDPLEVRVQWVNRGPLAVQVLEAEINDQPVKIVDSSAPNNASRSAEATLKIPAEMPISQPYWLKQQPTQALYKVDDPAVLGRPENPPALLLHADVKVMDTMLHLHRPLVYRTVDRVDGEQVRTVVVVPPVTVALSENLLVFPKVEKRSITASVKANRANSKGVLQLQVPAGFSVEPRSVPFEIAEEGGSASAAFVVTPPQGSVSGSLKAIAQVGSQNYSDRQLEISYPHIPPIVYFESATAKLRRTDILLSAKKIGYVMGSGDDVPAALRQLGAEVTLLEEKDLEAADLSQFQAIVTGVRAFNRRADLKGNANRLWKYVENGGVVVAQYNTMDDRFGVGADSKAGPFPFQLARDRVTVEESPVQFEADPLLQKPNSITSADFDGWVQERGLYFPTALDSRYKTLFSMSDPGEGVMKNSTIYAPLGKGLYIYTSLAFFRQLPAGVPGAMKLFANFVSAKAAVGGTSGR
jgi:LmbE family N-acetylglucosaminyl deacetylase